MVDKVNKIRKFPCKRWQIKVSKPVGDIKLLDSMEADLISKGCDVCIVVCSNKFILFRKAIKGEEHLTADSTKPFMARIVRKVENNV